MKLGPGDVVALLTDGFFEFQNPEGKMLGKDRIGDAIHQHRHETAKEILDALLRHMLAFAQDAPQLDDVTGVIIKREI